MSSPSRPGSAATRIARPRADALVRALPRSILRAGAIVALLAASGCLSTEEEQRLGTFRYNSKAYYDVGDYSRAEDQCKRGFEIDEDDPSLRRIYGYTLLMQATPEKLAKARDVFDDQIGFFGDDDWQLRLGYGMTLQQLARARAASKVEKERAEAPALREEAREQLDAAEEIASKGKNAPADITFHLALLDLDEGHKELFPEHARITTERLVELQKVLEVELRQPMGVKERERTERDLRVARERGQRITREAARLAWEGQDYKAAAAALEKLEWFGKLDRPDYYNRARIREQAGEYEGAVKDYTKFIDLSVGQTDDTVNRAVESLTHLRSELAERRTASQISTGR